MCADIYSLGKYSFDIFAHAAFELLLLHYNFNKPI